MVAVCQGGGVSDDYMTPRLARWKQITSGPLIVLAVGTVSLATWLNCTLAPSLLDSLERRLAEA